MTKRILTVLIVASLTLSALAQVKPFARRAAGGGGGPEIVEEFSSNPFGGAWTEEPSSSDFTWTDVDLDYGGGAIVDYMYARSTTALSSGVNQWACVRRVITDGVASHRGVVLRSDDGTTETRYALAVRTSDDRVEWLKIVGQTPTSIFTGGGTCGALDGDETVCFAVEGTGASTKVSGWINPALDGTPDPNEWGTESCTLCASGCTITADCTTGSACIDSGSYAGINVNAGSGTVATSFDEFKASAWTP